MFLRCPNPVVRACDDRAVRKNRYCIDAPALPEGPHYSRLGIDRDQTSVRSNIDRALGINHYWGTILRSWSSCNAPPSQWRCRSGVISPTRALTIMSINRPHSGGRETCTRVPSWCLGTSGQNRGHYHDGDYETRME